MRDTLVLIVVVMLGSLFALWRVESVKNPTAGEAHDSEAESVRTLSAEFVTESTFLPGPRIHTWKAAKEFSAPGRYELSIQHAASGAEGAFGFIAMIDGDDDGFPDLEIGRSALVSNKAEKWSRWQFTSPGGTLFVGHFWGQRGAVVYYQIGLPAPLAHSNVEGNNIYAFSTNVLPHAMARQRFTKIKLTPSASQSL